jgi:hypothetical protein
MYVIAPHRVIVGAGEIVVFNNFALLVEPRDGRRGLHKGFRIWVLTQDGYSTSSMGVVQYPEAFHSTHSTIQPIGWTLFSYSVKSFCG